MINLGKMKNYIKKNPQSDDTNVKRLSAIRLREINNTKKKMKKINEYMKKSDKRIERAGGRLIK